MRRFALLALGLALALVAGRAVFRALASEETKIRRVVGEMAAGFDAGSANRCVAGLADSWRDETSGLEREWLRQGLAQFFFQQHQAGGGAERYRVELPEAAFVVTLVPERPTSARLECVARFLELGPPETLAWEVSIRAELERGTAGWEIVATRHRTLSGERIGPH